MPHGKKHGLYENIRLKQQRVASGSGERMRKKGEAGAPSDKDFAAAAKTAKDKPKKKSIMKSYA